MNQPVSYPALSEIFDAIASSYDAVYGPQANLVMSRLREENLALLRAVFPLGFRLLEIGCGTGDEALALSQSGCYVFATDISPKMVAVTRMKAEQAGLSHRISALSMPAAEVHKLQPTEPFDGAFSSFGGLNCEPDLEGLADSLARVLKPGASFVCSFMSRFSPLETIWFLVHGRPAEAFRRQKPGWQQANISGGEGETVKVPVRYLAVSELVKAFSPYFVPRKTISLGLLLPPPYLNDLYRRHLSFWNRLSPLEQRLRGIWPMKYFGDHVVLYLQKI